MYKLVREIYLIKNEEEVTLLKKQEIFEEADFFDFSVKLDDKLSWPQVSFELMNIWKRKLEKDGKVELAEHCEINSIDEFDLVGKLYIVDTV